ncbi:BrnT family toxin [Nitrospira sp. KM1]|uniref:BrnT family toxin n=1 Tax=Nitrospira sp. KM1 TaxID=1936990 RepID=UPI0015661339
MLVRRTRHNISILNAIIPSSRVQARACRAVTSPPRSYLNRRMSPFSVSVKHRLLVVVHADRGSRIRIISARKATNSERKDHEEGETRESTRHPSGI